MKLEEFGLLNLTKNRLNKAYPKMNPFYKFMSISAIINMVIFAILTYILNYSDGERNPIVISIISGLLFGLTMFLFDFFRIRRDFNKIGVRAFDVEALNQAMEQVVRSSISAETLINKLKDHHFFRKSRIFQKDNEIQINSRNDTPSWGNPVHITADETMETYYNFTIRLLDIPKSKKVQDHQSKLMNLKKMAYIKEMLEV